MSDDVPFRLKAVSRLSRDHGRRLWDYCCLPPKESKAGFLLGFGCHDVGVAEYCAQIMRKDLASLAVVTGKDGHITRGAIKETEARLFKRIMSNSINKIEDDKIIAEDKAEHTLENIRLARIELSKPSRRYVDLAAGIAITKPYSTRRVRALVEKQWSSVEWYVCSESTSFDNYRAKFELYSELTMHFLVGEINRIFRYSGTSCLEQSIPDNIWNSYYCLREDGFDIDHKDLTKEENVRIDGEVRKMTKKEWLSRAAISALLESADL